MCEYELFIKIMWSKSRLCIFKYMVAQGWLLPREVEFRVSCLHFSMIGFFAIFIGISSFSIFLFAHFCTMSFL